MHWHQIHQRIEVAIYKLLQVNFPDERVKIEYDHLSQRVLLKINESATIKFSKFSVLTTTPEEFVQAFAELLIWMNTRNESTAVLEFAQRGSNEAFPRNMPSNGIEIQSEQRMSNNQLVKSKLET